MKMKIFGKAFTVLMLVIVLISLVSIFAGEKQKSGLESQLLRLHVIANSDSEEDQELKLKVRDAVLEKAGIIIKNADSVIEAKGLIELKLNTLENTAKRCLEENGCNLPVSMKLEKYEFPTKNYGVFSLPAGEYEALRVLIGEAEGQNWWCVLFPPLCNAAASEEFVSAAAAAGISEDDIALMEGKRVFRFRLTELFAYVRRLINT